ncbi:HYR domain-containing protein, partial [bacterium]|nr:HYR domain-containing protein [bacterium]
IRACKLTNANSLTPNLTCYDPGSFTLTLTTSDDKGATAFSTANVVVSDPDFIREEADCFIYQPQDYSDYAHKQTLFIPARYPGASAPVVNSAPLDSAYQYLIEVSGVYYAGGNGDYDIRADAKYSQDRYQRQNLLGWTDLVRNYASYTEVLLELKVDNQQIEWGTYNSDHTYSMVKPGNDSPMSFTLQIYDIAAYNNHGGLCVNLYQYVDSTAPEIADHDDVTVEATGPGGALVTYTPPTTADLVDGPGTATCVPDSGSQFALGKTTVSCSAIDKAGNVSTPTAFDIYVVDTTNPLITYVDRTPANGNGWNNSTVTLNWGCTDIVGVKQSAISIPVPTEGENQSVTAICKDTSGNTASDTQSGINIDLTAPTLVPIVSPNPVVLNGSAVATSGATDSLSGIATKSCGAVDTSSVGLKSLACTATDKAGNT